MKSSFGTPHCRENREGASARPLSSACGVSLRMGRLWIETNIYQLSGIFASDILQGPRSPDWGNVAFVFLLLHTKPQLQTARLRVLPGICVRLHHLAALLKLGVPERIVFANVLCGHKAGQHGAQGWSLARGKGSHVDVDRQKDCHKPCAGKVDHKAVLQGLLRDGKGRVSGTKAQDKPCHGKAKAKARIPGTGKRSVANSLGK